MNIIYLNQLDEDEQDDIFDEIVKLLKEQNQGFYNGRHNIYNHLNEMILFKKDNEIAGFFTYKKNNRVRKASIEIIQSFTKGTGSFMVDFFLKKFKPYNIYATQCLPDSLGFWAKMGFSSMGFSEDYEHHNNKIML